MDITPVYVNDDGSGGWAYVTLATDRRVLGAAGIGGAKTLDAKYHIPHNIKPGQGSGEMYFHLHVEFSDQTAGNVVMTVKLFPGKREVAYHAAYTLTYTLTPANYALDSNHVFELALPAGMEAYMEVDAIVSATITRDPSVVGDTYAGSVYFSTADFHVLTDQRYTTAKDEGTGWVKAS